MLTHWLAPFSAALARLLAAREPESLRVAGLRLARSYCAMLAYISISASLLRVPCPNSAPKHPEPPVEISTVRNITRLFRPIKPLERAFMSTDRQPANLLAARSRASEYKFNLQPTNRIISIAATSRKLSQPVQLIPTTVAS